LWGGGVFSTIYKVAVGWCVRTTRRWGKLWGKFHKLYV
jgi:hypothetical protein